MSSPVFEGYRQTHGLFWLLGFVEELLMNMLHLIRSCLRVLGTRTGGPYSGGMYLLKKPHNKPTNPNQLLFKSICFFFSV